MNAFRFHCVSASILAAFAATSFSALAQAGPPVGKDAVLVASVADNARLDVKNSVKTRAIEVTTDGAVAIESEEPFTELSIANPDIADISTISSSTIYVLGKRAGRTTLMLMGPQGQVMTIVDVRVSPDISEFKLRLSEILPGEKIEAFTANDGIVLSGSVSTQERMDRAIELARHYAPGLVSNLMSLAPMRAREPDVAEFEDRLRGILPQEKFHISQDQTGVVISGTVSSPMAKEHALKLAEHYAPGRVTSLVTVRESQPKTTDVSGLLAHLRDILPDEPIRVHQLGQALVLTGNVSSQERSDQAMRVARLAANGAPISNMLTVAEAKTCAVRTRRGAEVIQTTIPCNAQREGTAASSAQSTEADIGKNPLVAVALPSDLAPKTNKVVRPRARRQLN